MAKPRSFRCRALFSLALAPKCERHGMGRGEEGAAGGPWRPDLGRPGRSCSGGGKTWPVGVRRPVPAPRIGTDVKVLGWNPHFLGLGKGHRGREAAFLGGWDGGGVGWAGGDFS